MLNTPLFCDGKSVPVPQDFYIKKRLFWRATHRGIKEMDLILGAFAEKYLASFCASELEEFSALLEVPDQEIFAWVLGQNTPSHSTPFLDFFLQSSRQAIS